MYVFVQGLLPEHNESSQQLSLAYSTPPEFPAEKHGDSHSGGENERKKFTNPLDSNGKISLCPSNVISWAKKERINPPPSLSVSIVT